MAKKAKPAVAPPQRVSPEIIQKFAGSVVRLKEAVDSANGEYRAELKKAKAAGVNTGILLDSLRQKKRDLDQVNADLRDKVYYHGILGMPVEQAWLFGNPEVPAGVAEQVTVQDAEAAGFTAGKSGGARGDNLHPAGSAMFAAWDRGYQRGQATIAKRMGQNAKTRPASTRKTRAAEPGLPLGETPPQPAAAGTGKKKAAKDAKASNGAANGASTARGASRKRAAGPVQHGATADAPAPGRAAVN